MLPPKGALFALGRPGGEKAPTLRSLWPLAAPQGGAFRLGAARRRKGHPRCAGGILHSTQGYSPAWPAC
ncbi:hypothetical protein F7Q88_11100 [Castellaniella defragrans]|nr:hypothetical protein F7Q88_11100 [Castellaniella defragrans]